jgi:hypothetical protein
VARPSRAPTPCGHAAFGLCVEKQVPGGEQQHRGQHRQVAPVAPGRDLARRDEGEDGQEGPVDDRRDGRADQSGSGDGETARQPEQEQAEERPADHRQPAGPVRDRRQEEAVEHLVDVPVDEGEAGRKVERAGEHHDPQRHCDRRPEGRAEKERAEARA